MVATKTGELYLGTNAGVFEVTPQTKGTPAQSQLLLAGYCPSVATDPMDTLWIGCDTGLYQRRLDGWIRWQAREGMTHKVVSALAADGAGNLWVGGAGLLRYYNYVEEAPVEGTRETRLEKIVADGEGGVVLGRRDGTVVHVNRDGTQVSLEVGPGLHAEPRENFGYYPGALIARARDRSIYVLNHNGLYRFSQGQVNRLGPYPSVDPRSSPVSCLAALDEDTVVAGQLWVPAVHRFASTSWQVLRRFPLAGGGSAVTDVLFDRQGRLWASTTQQVAVFQKAGWSDTEIFTEAPDTKRNLFGALIEDERSGQIIASGPWGYPVTLEMDPSGHLFRRDMPPTGAAQPYVFRQVIQHPIYGPLAATDSGLRRWSASGWADFSIGDRRLLSGIQSIAEGAGSSFWVLRERLWRVTLPSVRPFLEAATPIPDILQTTSTTIALRGWGLCGPKESRNFEVTFDPAVPAFGAGGSSARREYALQDLTDGRRYTYRATVVDAFGNKSPELNGAFTVRLPWHKSPPKVAALILAALATLLVLITRRGPMGFLLRVVAGKRWTFRTEPPDLILEITRPDASTLDFGLQAPTRRATVLPAVSGAFSDADWEAVEQGMRRIAKEAGALVPEGIHPVLAVASDLGAGLYRRLPGIVRFAYEQSPTGSLQLVLDESLLGIPWELLNAGAGQLACLQQAVGRRVSSAGRVAVAPAEKARRFEALIFAPKAVADAGHEDLAQRTREVRAVTHRLRGWGAHVTVVEGTISAADLAQRIANSHIFHFVGHAEFDASEPGESALVCGDGSRVTARQLAGALGSKGSRTWLAFINGCVSGRETAWTSGPGVFGLASPFLNGGTYFIGTQWPIQDAFGWEFADVFYQKLFPREGAIWWKWLRGRELSGDSIGEALRQARLALSPREAAAPTWPAYLYYGDPSFRITLE
jgi:hypothetical protein